MITRTKKPYFPILRFIIYFFFCSYGITLQAQSDIKNTWDSLSLKGLKDYEIAEEILGDVDPTAMLPEATYLFISEKMKGKKGDRHRDLRIIVNCFLVKSKLTVGDSRRALRLLYLAKKEIHDDPKSKWRVPILFLYSRVSRTNRDYEQAVRYLEEALALNIEDSPLYHRGDVLQMYAVNLLHVGRKEDGLAYLKQAKKYWIQENNAIKLRAWYYRMGEFAEARHDCQEALRLFTLGIAASPDKSYLTHSAARMYRHMAECHFRNSNYDSARYYINLAIPESQGKSGEANNLRRSLYLKSIIASKLGRAKDASEALLTYHQVLSRVDSINEAKSKSVLNVKGTTFDEVVREVENLEIEKEKNLEHQKTQNIILSFMLLAICFVIGLLIFLYHTLKKKQSLNLVMEKKNQQLQLMQEKLVESEKMAVIGQLSSVISHEINSPLGVIRSTAEYLMDGIEHDIRMMMNDSNVFDEEAHTFIMNFIRKNLTETKTVFSTREERRLRKSLKKTLEEENIRNEDEIYELLSISKIYMLDDDLKKLIHREENLSLFQIIAVFLKWFSGINNIQKSVLMTDKISYSMRTYAFDAHTDDEELINVVENLESVLEMFEFIFRKGIIVKREMDTSAWTKGYAEPLKQVWSNLIQNSLHAMKNKGELTVKLQNNGENIIIKIADTGHGIPEEIRDKIFDPLYTTKAKGEGSGLGLDIVKTLLEQHRGSISFESTPGKTTFTVKLPAVQPSEE